MIDTAADGKSLPSHWIYDDFEKLRHHQANTQSCSPKFTKNALPEDAAPLLPGL
jgi:hypothetical protein